MLKENTHVNNRKTNERRIDTMTNKTDYIDNFLALREAILMEAKDEYLDLAETLSHMNEVGVDYGVDKAVCRREIKKIEDWCLSDDFDVLTMDMNIQGNVFLNLLRKSAEDILEGKRDSHSHYRGCISA